VPLMVGQDTGGSGNWACFFGPQVSVLGLKCCSRNRGLLARRLGRHYVFRSFRDFRPERGDTIEPIFALNLPAILRPAQLKITALDIEQLKRAVGIFSRQRSVTIKLRQHVRISGFEGIYS